VVSAYRTKNGKSEGDVKVGVVDVAMGAEVSRRLFGVQLHNSWPFSRRHQRLQRERLFCETYSEAFSVTGDEKHAQQQRQQQHNISDSARVDVIAAFM